MSLRDSHFLTANTSSSLVADGFSSQTGADGKHLVGNIAKFELENR